MANDLSALLPTAYEQLDIVSRELSGFIPAMMLDASAARVAKGQPVDVPIAPLAVGEDAAAGTTPPDTGDKVWGKVQITMTKDRVFPFRWTGEDQKQVNSAAGLGYQAMRGMNIAQALRAAVNEIEADCAALYSTASRAYGTAGTAPFATNLGDSAQVLKLLKDNGAPPTDLQLVIDTTAGAAMRTLSQLTKANEAGGTDLLRQGVLLSLHGMNVRESAMIKAHTKGTGTGYLSNLLAGYPVGATSIAIDTGSGTVVAGDIVTFAGDLNKYVVKTGVAAAGTIVLEAPGLRQTLADGVAMTIGANYSAMMAFHRGALVLAARPPAMPEEGDQASDSEIITDDRTGLSFDLRVYKQVRRVRYELGLVWGVANIKPEHSVLLLG